MRHLFESEETVKAELKRVLAKKLIRRVDGVNEADFLEITKLLKVVLINVTINKSLLSSLFNTKSREQNGDMREHRNTGAAMRFLIYKTLRLLKVIGAHGIRLETDVQLPSM